MQIRMIITKKFGCNEYWLRSLFARMSGPPMVLKATDHLTGKKNHDLLLAAVVTKFTAHRASK